MKKYRYFSPREGERQTDKQRQKKEREKGQRERLFNSNWKETEKKGNSK